MRNALGNIQLPSKNGKFSQRWAIVLLFKAIQSEGSVMVMGVTWNYYFLKFAFTVTEVIRFLTLTYATNCDSNFLPCSGVVMECGDQPESKRLPLSSDGCLKMRRERKYRGGGQRKWNGGKMGGWENGKCWNHGCLHTHMITLYSHRYLCCGFINNILADGNCMHVCSCIKLITCFPVPLIPYRRTYFLIFIVSFLNPCSSSCWACSVSVWSQRPPAFRSAQSPTHSSFR